MKYFLALIKKQINHIGEAIYSLECIWPIPLPIRQRHTSYLSYDFIINKNLVMLAKPNVFKRLTGEAFNNKKDDYLDAIYVYPTSDKTDLSDDITV